MSDRTLMLSLLQQVESVMRANALWESDCPSFEALESRLPFCVDTLQFSQWLQWIFIARFRALLDGDHPLPTSCNIAAMAEQAFEGLDSNLDELIELLRQFDSLFE